MCPEVDGVAGVGHTGHSQKKFGRPVMLALSGNTRTIAANYQTCHENAEQMRVLQTWIREMKFAAEQ